MNIQNLAPGLVIKAITIVSGVSHGDDLISLFHFNVGLPMIKNGVDFDVSRRMVQYWVNFVEQGCVKLSIETRSWQP